MPSRFYFDLTNGPDTIRDLKGVDAIGPGEAIMQAQAVLDEMRSNNEAPAPGNGWQLVIRDENGMTLSAISLDEAVVH